MVFLFAAAGLVTYAFRDGIEFFRAPSQVVADQPSANEVFRLGGLVKEGTLETFEGTQISFVVTDQAEEVAVSYTGILPDLFREGVVDALKEQGVYEETN